MSGDTIREALPLARDRDGAAHGPVPIRDDVALDDRVAELNRRHPFGLPRRVGLDELMVGHAAQQLNGIASSEPLVEQHPQWAGAVERGAAYGRRVRYANAPHRVRRCRTSMHRQP
ncbi:MAG: hypothetical protein ACRDPC_00160 [Solirubrobacteraceae bacterium]